MSDESPWRKLGDEILDILKDRAKKALDEDKDFWKEAAQDLAKLKWQESTTSDDAKKASLRHEMEIVEATIQVKLARTALKASKEIQSLALNILGVVGKTLASSVLRGVF